MIPRLGLRGTCLSAGSLDALLAIGAWRLSRRGGGGDCGRTERVQAAPLKPRGAGGAPGRGPGPGWGRATLRAGGAFGAEGAVAMIYEVGWFRVLALVLGPSVHAFSIMLTVFLMGVGLGSLAAAKWAARLRHSRDWFAALQGALGITGLLGLGFVNRLPGVYF